MTDRAPCIYMMASGYLGTLYVGVTSDLAARVTQHRAGTFHGFTERYRIKRLVWCEAAPTMNAAIAREKSVKRWRRDWKIARIARDNPHWHDLGPVIGLLPLGE